MSLAWGRRYLMCPPRFFEVAYEINPWMHAEVRVDPDRAEEQWEALKATLEAAGAAIEVLDPQPGVPDLVFTANAGLVNGSRFVPSRFRHPERRPETAINVAWFQHHGFDIATIPDGMDHEGAGDALPFGDVLVSAYRWRSDASAAAELAAILGTPVRSIELVDRRLYHLDLTFCPLDDRRAICAPTAWDAYGRRVIADLVPEPLYLDDEEVASFCANSVVVGDTVVMPATPPRVGKQLEAWGFDVVECCVDEFLKAGGGPRCLTLALDVDLTSGATRPDRSAPA